MPAKYALIRGTFGVGKSPTIEEMAVLLDVRAYGIGLEDALVTNDRSIQEAAAIW